MNRSLLVATVGGVVFGGLMTLVLDQRSDANSLVAAVTTARTAIAETAAVHCEIPCGLYNDHDQIKQLRLDAKTIEKANAQIEELMAAIQMAADPAGTGQLANTMMRWVLVKEEHSKKIQHTVGWYFMTQKIKPPVEGDAEARSEYLNKLAGFHAVSRSAMKAAQSTDPSASAALFKAIDAVAPWYPAG